MIDISLQKISSVLAGELVLKNSQKTPADTVCGSAQTDSRLIGAGDIFFARRGEEADGHNYVDSAIKKGAELIICERELDIAVPQIIVADSTKALADLARFVIATLKEKTGLKVIGVTGSNGKTTTKNLLRAMLSKLGNTVANEKSFNNDVGGPLTMLKAGFDTEYLVVEMGASGPGEIRRLAEIAKPDYGVVLMVGLAHAGGFGDIETTAKTKREMVEALTSEGCAVLNAADPRVRDMAGYTRARVRYFAAAANAVEEFDDSCVSASNIQVSAAGTEFVLHLDGKSKPVKFAVLGEHHVANALAAATVAADCGLGLEEIIAVLEEAVRPAKWRMEVKRCRDEITVINDAYNANPDSMAAALKTLAQIAKPQGRTIAVLGQMSELGNKFGPEHDRIGVLAVRLRISQLIVVGENVRRMYISAINEGAWDAAEAHYFADSDSAYEFLKKQLQAHDTVLVKSSNAAGLRYLGDRIVEALA